MKTPSTILFCSSPFNDGEVDPDYQEEYDAARKNGFTVALFSYENLILPNNTQPLTKKLKPSEQPSILIYRGWMLTNEQYTLLYNELKTKNYHLINSPQEYRNCHYLPDSLKYIHAKTARTIYQKFEGEDSIQQLMNEATVFGNNPIIIKDYVKSEKHNWDSACYVPDASNKEKLYSSIKKLIELRDKYLNEGIVIREFMELKELTTHSKSGMPLTEEYRLFFVNKKLLGVYDYWEEGTYVLERPDTLEFEELAQTVESNFFSMDIARKKTGEFVIIELGDGQVAGLPDKLEKQRFYEKLKLLIQTAG